jgi:CubicO group peptidase (beta-lactamase class C family)
MADKRQYLDQKTKAVLDKYDLPNIAAVLVRDNGQTVVHSAQGIRDRNLSAGAASNKVTKNDYFNVGSISKPITGLLLACLIKQNILSWNTKVSDVFPEFKVKAFRDRCCMNENFLNTKVYELMAHTSGINGTYFHTPDGKPFVMDGDGDLVANQNGDTDPYRFIADQGIQWGGNSRDKEWQNHQSLVYQRYLYTILSLKNKVYLREFSGLGA